MKKTYAAAILFMCFTLAGACACAQSYRYGDYADEVSVIQQALEELDLYYADITGHYGTKTERAVKLFQKKYGLEQTGIADEDTLLRLYMVADIENAPTVSENVGPRYSSSAILRRDSTGSAVRKLQEDLTKLKFYHGTITGNYGGLTQEAVRRFQKKHGLDADGIAGPKTLAKLATIMGESISGELNATEGNISSSGQTTSILLQHGMRSDAVKKLQEDLDELDYYTGTVTGKYGNLTKEAVRRFQRDNGLASDGIAGPKTLAKIASKLTGEEAKKEETGGTAETPSEPADAAGTIAPSVSLGDVSKLNTEITLRIGSRSGYVTRLQKALTALGYFSDKCDGYFGGITEEAVIRYQRARGLTEDGIAGRATLRAINKDIEDGVTASTVLVD